MNVTFYFFGLVYKLNVSAHVVGYSILNYN